jgi:hypothetical protein
MTTETRRSVLTVMPKIFSDLLSMNFNNINYAGMNIAVEE